MLIAASKVGITCINSKLDIPYQSITDFDLSVQKPVRHLVMKASITLYIRIVVIIDG